MAKFMRNSIGENTQDCNSFFHREFEKQKSEKDHNSSDGLQHLGFNAGEGGVKITEDVVKRLEEQYKNNFYDCFAHEWLFLGTTIPRGAS